MMKPVYELQKKAESIIGEKITLPGTVQSARKFYEGIISYAQSKGNHSLVDHGLKIGTRAQLSWQSGWNYAELLAIRKESVESINGLIEKNMFLLRVMASE